MTTRTKAPRYLFERELGNGGFGNVVLATDFVLGRRVALKSLRGGDSRALAGEARVLAGLRHPNIVQVHDLTAIDGEPYLVLEYVDGHSLRELLTDGPLPARQAVRHALAIASALRYAHRQGVVHNDVKPENVMVATNGATLLTDFGVANSSRSATLLPGEAESIAGSLPYIAPELIQGAAPGEQSDFYALAATLYEMLSGAPPFGGAGAAGMAQRLAGPPPRLAIAEPRWTKLSDILERALAPLPSDRYPDGDAFTSDLSSAQSLEARPSPVTVPKGKSVSLQQSRHRRRTAIGTALALLGVAMLGAAAVFANQQTSETDGSGLRGLAIGTPAATETPATATAAPTGGATASAAGAATAVPPSATRPPVPANPRDAFPGVAKGKDKKKD